MGAKELGQAIRDRRTELGMTQKDLTEAIGEVDDRDKGRSERIVTDWERGKRRPQLNSLALIDKALAWVPGTAYAILNDRDRPDAPVGSELRLADLERAIADLRETQEQLRAGAAQEIDALAEQVAELRNSVRDIMGAVRLFGVTRRDDDGE